MNVFRGFALASALYATCANTATAATAPHTPKPFDINEVRIGKLIQAIQCLPHEPQTTSNSPAKTAIADGDAVLSEGHCQAAIADYQVAIDADPSNVTALWKQDIAAARQAQLTQDVKIAHDDGEMAYHDADLAVQSHPNAAVFLYLRAVTRYYLIPVHVRGRSAFTLAHYIKSEIGHSYDDLSAAIKAVPNYGAAYAGRWLLDVRNGDTEQAQYDLAQAQKYDPESANDVVALQQAAVQRSEEMREDQIRKQIALANAMMGLAVAASGGNLILVPAP
jgi:tetratricopeptide (TPR) repeat protein